MGKDVVIAMLVIFVGRSSRCLLWLCHDGDEACTPFNRYKPVVVYAADQPRCLCVTSRRHIDFDVGGVQG